MAIVGEPTENYVIKEVNWRQSAQYKGFENPDRIGLENTGEKDENGNYIYHHHNHLQYLNNQNAWVKMASSVYIGGAEEDETLKQTSDSLGRQRLASIGLNPDNFFGNELAKKFILFNGVSELNKPNTRSGIANNANLWNSNFSYGLGGSDFGIQPVPGIDNVEIECLNRGSIRRAQINLKAYNKFQFELIEMLYLRIGYHILLEFGNDKYYDHSDKSYANVGNTLLEKKWFSADGASQLDMLAAIREERKKYSGNYEGFFGRVTNFSWDITPEGTYDITIQLHTVGDIIESLQVNLPFPGRDAHEIVNNVSGSALLDQEVENIMDAILFNAEESKCENESNLEYISLNAAYTTAENKLETSDPDKFRDIKKTKEKYTRYITFREVCKHLNEYCIPIITPTKGNPNSLVTINTSPQFMGYHLHQTSLDPRVCIFRTPSYEDEKLMGNIERFWWNDMLNPFVMKISPKKDEKLIGGNIMNLYLNFDFVKKSMRQNLSKDGKLSLFKFLQNICNGINSALGNVNKLEPIIEDDYLISIIDQNPIPGAIESQNNSVQFKTFGYDVKDKQSSIIKDISLNTSITPEMATMVTIGATANGGKVKGIDSTYFSKWNAGLTDRFNKKTEQKELDKDKLEESIQESFIIKLGEEWDALEDNEAKNAKENPYREGRLLQSSNTYIGGGGFSNDPTHAYVKDDDLLPKGYYTRDEYIGQKLYLWKIKNEITKEDLESKAKLKNNYFRYLIEAFGSKKSLVIDNGIYFPANSQPKYLEYNESFISRAKSSYAEYLNAINKEIAEKVKEEAKKLKDLYSSDQIGFIPFNLGITLEGLSGVKIYNKIDVDQKFLPKNYPEILHFITTKVNHYIRDNKWETQLETLVLPKTSLIKYENTRLKFEDRGDENVLPEDQRGADSYRTDENTEGKDFYFLEGRNVSQLLRTQRSWFGGYGKNNTHIDVNEIILDFHPDVRNAFKGFLTELRDTYTDYYALINSIYRTPDKSEKLGKEQVGQSVAKRGKSRHTWGAAIDMNVYTPGYAKGEGIALRKQGNYQDWKNSGITDLAKKYNILWGGEFEPRVTKEDSVHFYHPYDKKIVEDNVANILFLFQDKGMTLEDIHPHDVKLFVRMSNDEITKVFSGPPYTSNGFDNRFQYPKRKYNTY